MPSGIYIHKPLSEETKRKISLANKGRKMSDEFKEKMRVIQKNIPGFKRYNFTIGFRLPENKHILNWQKNKRNRLKQATCKELGTHTYGEWELLKKQYNYTCPCCGLSEPFIGQKSEYLTEDHIIPLSKGGSDLIENIQPLCLSCNIKKHTKIIKY